MTGKLSKNFHGVDIGPLSNILAVKCICVFSKCLIKNLDIKDYPSLIEILPWMIIKIRWNFSIWDANYLKKHELLVLINKFYTSSFTYPRKKSARWCCHTEKSRTLKYTANPSGGVSTSLISFLQFSRCIMAFFSIFETDENKLQLVS